MVSLGKIFNSIKDGMSKPEDWFQPGAEKTTAPESLKEKIKQAKKESTVTPPTQPDEEIF
jgi:hypothetical protein